MTSPSRCPTCGRRHKRSNPQNALLWALYTLMAEREWPDYDAAGKKIGMTHYSADSFHKYYKARFLGCEDVKLPTGQTMTTPRSTADLDVEKFSDYFDRVQADAAERGVFLDELPA